MLVGEGDDLTQAIKQKFKCSFKKCVGMNMFRNVDKIIQKVGQPGEEKRRKKNIGQPSSQTYHTEPCHL